jgi:hypothetical protein
VSRQRPELCCYFWPAGVKSWSGCWSVWENLLKQINFTAGECFFLLQISTNNRQFSTRLWRTQTYHV